MKTGSQQTKAKRRRRKRQAVWEMNVKSTRHYWGSYLNYDILTAGQFVPEKLYFDCGGMRCVSCYRTVIFWDEKYREDAGEIKRRSTGKTAKNLPKYGCPGPIQILMAG